MPPFDITHAFDGPLVQVVLAVVAVALAFVLLRELRRIQKSLLVLMATAFLDMVGLLMIVPLLPFYAMRLGAEAAVFGQPLGIGSLTGMLAATFTLAQSISSPLWGRFSDRFGRRPALLVALTSSAIAYVLFGLAESLTALFLARLVQGAGGGTVGVIQAYVADTAAAEDRARALGWLSAATNLGVALGPVVGTFALWLGQFDLWPGEGTVAMGRSGPGLLAALLCCVTIAFAWRWLRETHGQQQRAHTSSRRALLDVVVHPGRPASRLIWTYAIAIGAFQGTTAVLAPFLHRRWSVTESEIGWFYMYSGAISVFARILLLGWLVDRLREVKLSRIGIVTLATGLALLPLAASLPALALAVALMPLGTAFTFPCVTALLSRVIPPADRGLYMGLQQTFGGAARIVMPLVYGWMFDVVGIESPYFCAAALVLLTIVLGFGLGPLAMAKRSPAAG